MALRDEVIEVLQALPEGRVRQVLDFALALKGEGEAAVEDLEWRAFALHTVASRHGGTDPEYTRFGPGSHQQLTDAEIETIIAEEEAFSEQRASAAASAPFRFDREATYEERLLPPPHR